MGRVRKGVGGPEDEGRSSPNTGLPGEHDTHTHTHSSVTASPSERLPLCVVTCAMVILSGGRGESATCLHRGYGVLCVCYGWLGTRRSEPKKQKGNSQGKARKHTIEARWKNTKDDRKVNRMAS